MSIESFQISVSRKWILMLSIFILFNTILFGLAIFTQVTVVYDLHKLVTDMHEHTVYSKQNRDAIVDSALRIEEQSKTNKAIDQELTKQSTEIERINKLKSVKGSK